MDSLADFLSFGLAPAYVMYLFLLKDFGFWGYPVAFIFALCGSLRLAYFNVLSQEGKASKKYFSGLPIPMAAGILASFVISYSLLESNEVSRSFKLLQALMPMIYNLIPFIMLALGVLMVSRIPFPAFKQANFLRPKSIKTLLLLVVLVFLVIRYPQDALFLLFVVYAISGVLVYLWKGFRGMGKPKPDESAAQ
jgi:CDP-diacylglycerol--serine O-phosphatidyltransferase